MPRTEDEAAAKELRMRLPDTRLFATELTAPRENSETPTRTSHANRRPKGTNSVREKAKAATRKRRAAAKAAACERGIGYDTKKEAADVAHWATVTRGSEHTWILCDTCNRYHVIPVPSID